MIHLKLVFQILKICVILSPIGRDTMFASNATDLKIKKQHVVSKLDCGWKNFPKKAGLGVYFKKDNQIRRQNII